MAEKLQLQLILLLPFYYQNSGRFEILGMKIV